MSDLVKIDNDQVVTDSRSVAEHFGKQHKNVLQAIENLAAENSATKKLFYEATFENRPGVNGEFVEDHAKGNHQKQVQNFEWYVDYLLPIVQREFMN